MLSSVTDPRVKNRSTPDNIARGTAETLMDHRDSLEERAHALYDNERKVGEPSWYNAHPNVRKAYRDRVETRDGL